jgi:AcrR family transcriptional regulator
MREQIIHVAAELFSKNGYAGTSISAIVDAVGISPAALYWHFKSKEDLLAELMREANDNYDDRVEAALAGTSDPADQLRRLAAAHTIAVLTDPKVARGVVFSNYSLVHSISAANYRRMYDRWRDQLERWRRIVDAGDRDGEFDVLDPAVSVFALTDICESVGGWFHADGPLSAEEVASQYGEVALRIVGRGLPHSDRVSTSQASVRSEPRAPAVHDRGKRSQTDDDDTSLRETVLRESAALFRAKGFAGTSVSDIARAAHMSPASLYWHFANKEDLLFALVSSGMDEYEACIEEELANAEGPVERLAAHARGHLHSVFVDPNVSDMARAYSAKHLAHSLSGAHYSTIHGRLARAYRLCRNIVSEGMDAGVFQVAYPTVAAFAILDMCDSVSRWYEPGGSREEDEVTAQYCELALRIAGYRLTTAGRQASPALARSRA